MSQSPDLNPIEYVYGRSWKRCSITIHIASAHTDLKSMNTSANHYVVFYIFKLLRSLCSDLKMTVPPSAGHKGVNGKSDEFETDANHSSSHQILTQITKYMWNKHTVEMELVYLITAALLLALLGKRVLVPLKSIKNTWRNLLNRCNCMLERF